MLGVGVGYALLPPTLATYFFAAVCGSNGLHYNNICSSSCANNGLKVQYPANWNCRWVFIHDFFWYYTPIQVIGSL